MFEEFIAPVGYVRNEALSEPGRIFKCRVEYDAGHRIEFVGNNRVAKAKGFKRYGTATGGRIEDDFGLCSRYRITGKRTAIPVQILREDLYGFPRDFLNPLGLGKRYARVHMGRISRHHLHR